jgi:DNA invertase Pin-like site-specific DNA recombinase
MAIKALGYSRTSSAANVEGDSETRQRAAIERYAGANGIMIDDADWFYDAAVSGTDPVQDRPGFAAMLDRIDGNGVRLVIVEDASRFARSLMAQELGVLVMQQRRVRVITANGDDLTETDDPSRIMMRQIAGAFAQYEKARLVAKLKAARDRKSAQLGRRVEGAKGHRAAVPSPIFGAVKGIVERSPAATMRVIVEELTARGLLTGGGKPFSQTQVARVISALGLEKIDGRSREARA